MASILVVDDRAENRNLLVRLLADRGHRMLEAADGAEALTVARSARPALVITDILVRRVDGYELVRRLRSDSELASTQVIFYTAHFHRREAEKNLAQALGVTHVLTKPEKPEVILKVVADALVAAGGVPPQGTAELAQFSEDHMRVMTDEFAAAVDALSSVNARLRALIDVNLELASQREPQALLDSVCRHACDLVGARCAIIAVTRTQAEPVTRFATAGVDEPHGKQLGTPEFGRGMTGHAYRDRKSARLAAVSDPPIVFGLPEWYPPFRNLLVAPVSSASQTYGWLALSDKVDADEFSPEHERLIGMLAAEVGRIYENASLYDQLLQQTAELRAQMGARVIAEEKVRRLNRVYALLSGVNALIVRVRDRDELFREACRVAVEHGSFALAWISVIETAHVDLVPVAWAGAGAAEYLAVSAERHEPEKWGIRGRVIASGELSFINDLAVEAPESLGPRRREALRRGYRSIVALPLMTGSRSVGVMTLLAREPNFFNEDEVKLLNELGSDISFALEHIENETKLHQLAFYDATTGLPNRTLFQERITHALSIMSQQGCQLALVLCDIKRFRHVNDSLGTRAGDALLREVTNRALSICPADHLARIGADVFGGFIAPIGTAADAAHSVKRLFEVFRSPLEIAGRSISIDINVGIAIAPADGAEVDTLFASAQAALRQAKTSGQEYLFYQPAMNASVTETLIMESGLRHAVHSQEFVLHYQPKYSLSSGRMSGLEALIRWNRPEHGLVPPARFIPLLEETGLILDTGRWALCSAIEDYKRWEKNGLDPPRVSVNVSPVQLRHENFVQEVRDAVIGCAVRADALELELTESVLMGDVEANVQKLAAIRDMGVHISVDDFGTGYSSLSYLANLPVNELKIDRSFIMRMSESPESMAIVSTILSLARALGLHVVAEGVETWEQSRLLKLLRCDEAQGYLFSAPVPSADVPMLIAQRHSIH